MNESQQAATNVRSSFPAEKSDAPSGSGYVSHRIPKQKLKLWLATASSPQERQVIRGLLGRIQFLSPSKKKELSSKKKSKKGSAK